MKFYLHFCVAALLYSKLISSYDIRPARNSIPGEIFRADVEPSAGGKVPEAAHLRIDLNKIDAAGLDNADAVRLEQIMAEKAPALLDKTRKQGKYKVKQEKSQTKSAFKKKSNFPFQSDFSEFSDFSSDFPYNPVFDPIKISAASQPNEVESPVYTNPYEVMYDSLFDKPKKQLSTKKKDTYKYVDIAPDYSPPKTTYSAEPDYAPGPAYAPEPSYAPEPAYIPEPAYAPEPAYIPEPAYAPEPAYIPEPAYAPEPAYVPEPAYKPEPAYAPPKPVYSPPPIIGPVLLEKRPYEVKSVQPLPITVAETYTSFDCRNKPYPGRHYADAEAGCQIYHFCYEDGRQETFQCGYGTVFNEYIGTCDFKNNVHCVSGEGYAAKPHHEPGPYHEPSQYHEPASYHEPAPYHEPVPYHEPAPYNEPERFHKPSFYQEPSGDIQPFTNFGNF